MTANEIWRFALSLSVAFPAIAAIIRFWKIDKAYRPFLVYLFVSLLNELLMGLFIVPQTQSKDLINLNTNIFDLFEAIILLVQFKYWKRFDRYSKIFFVLLVAIIFGWVLENLIIDISYHFHVVFLISYSFLTVLLSVQTINHIIVNENRVQLIKNPRFVICIALIIFFIYTIFVYTLMAMGIRVYDKALMTKIFAIQVYINAFTNLLYGIAVCLIPNLTLSKDLFKDMPL